MGVQFHETMYGKRFFEHQLPKLIQAIENLSKSIEMQTKMKDNVKHDANGEKAAGGV